MNGPLVLSKSNTLIFNVPKSDELLARVCSVFFAKSKGYSINAGNIPIIVRSDLFRSMPSSDLEVHKSLLNLSQAQKDGAAKWDVQVEKIREALSVNNSAGLPGAIPPKNILARPVTAVLASFSNYGPELQQAVLRARRTPPVSSTAGAMRALGNLRVTGTPVFAGGNANTHAPLYPRMVMNGGAHPFAVLDGGAVEPAAVLDAKIKQLLAQYQTVTGVPLTGALAAQIQGYYPTVNQALKEVKEKLQELANANAALAQYPRGVGVDPPKSAAELKAYADRGAELNKAAERAARKMDKLEEIKNLLQDLVDRQGPSRV
jgi:hypothetical protein